MEDLAPTATQQLDLDSELREQLAAAATQQQELDGQEAELEGAEAWAQSQIQEEPPPQSKAMPMGPFRRASSVSRPRSGPYAVGEPPARQSHPPQ